MAIPVATVDPIKWLATALLLRAFETDDPH
jgi:hypothetical protein